MLYFKSRKEISGRTYKKEKMIKNKESLEKAAKGIIFGLIILILLFVFVFKPNIKNINVLSAKIKELKAKVSDAEKEVKMIPNLKTNISKLDEQLKKYQNDMPQPTPDWLLERVNSLAGETGIVFDKMEHKGYITQLDSYWLQGLYLEMKTDYHSLGRFINKLENSSPFLNVLEISITGNKSDINKHIIKILIGAYVFTEK